MSGGGWKRSRRDKTHMPIVHALKAIGALVKELHRVGEGMPDLLVCYRGRLMLLECKSPDGRLEESQEDFIRDGWPVHVVHDGDEAIGAVCYTGAPGLNPYLAQPKPQKPSKSSVK
jgi:hypothetical protein